jgi:hypothetical protein
MAPSPPKKKKNEKPLRFFFGGLLANGMENWGKKCHVKNPILKMAMGSQIGLLGGVFSEEWANMRDASGTCWH